MSTVTDDQKTVVALDEVIAKLDMAAPIPFSLEHAEEDLILGLYKPQSPDEQSPHEQDEYYFVARGNGEISVNGVIEAFTTGDALFVPAGADHGFLNTSADFYCWVIFYGPKFEIS
jgi:mannose-6-phosphate isomerase-like protein (cupin superfamily)|tara:strand:- start:2298 stop:2645 length:348 start_codon:yes stop_codon:yes gene_type:complete